MIHLSGGNICDLCRRPCSEWYVIPIVDKNLTNPVKKVVCVECAAAQTFWYLDDNGFLRYNSVSVLYTSSIVPKSG